MADYFQLETAGKTHLNHEDSQHVPEKLLQLLTGAQQLHIGKPLGGDEADDCQLETGGKTQVTHEDSQEVPAKKHCQEHNLHHHR